MNAPVKEISAIEIEAKRRELARLLDAAEARHRDAAHRAVLEENPATVAAAKEAKAEVENIKQRQETLEIAAKEVERVEREAERAARYDRRQKVKAKALAALDQHNGTLGKLMEAIEAIVPIIDALESDRVELQRLVTGPDGLEGSDRTSFLHLLKLGHVETGYLQHRLYKAGFGPLGIMTEGKFLTYPREAEAILADRRTNLAHLLSSLDEED